MGIRTVIGGLVTGVVFAAAVVVAVGLWRRYMYAPWTRDGRIKADVVSIAPDVSGMVDAVSVRENQWVRRGEVLFQIDGERYRYALEQAEGVVAARKSELELKRGEAERRASLAGDVVSSESRETAAFAAATAAALLREAQAVRDTALLNLRRTRVDAPVDGYVTNLDVHPGDYATAGRALLAVIDSHSFRVNGYFEETKLPFLHVGDPVTIRLMSGGQELRGHIDSLSRGITDRDNPVGPRLLADVNPTFNWVRLAQRVPVRITIDRMPDHGQLAAGMTCTVIVRPHAGPAAGT